MARLSDSTDETAWPTKGVPLATLSHCTKGYLPAACDMWLLSCAVDGHEHSQAEEFAIHTAMAR